MRDENKRSVRELLEAIYESAVFRDQWQEARTFLFRFSAESSRCATVDVLCRIAPSPNQCDWYPYRIMRAFGATAGSMLFSSSQLIHRWFSLVPAFLHQLSSG
jgi:hypothetical protein